MPFALKGIAPFAAATFFGIGLVQLYGPAPKNHRVESTQSVRKPAAVHSRGKGRMVEFDGGRWVYNASDLPHIGSDQATRVLVEYFDYQCPACRTMRGYLAALAAKYPKDICVVMLPVPLEGACNRSLGPTDVGHPGSCEFTRLALAVWRFKPARFQEFHEAVLGGMPLAEAGRMAEEILTPENRAAALRDRWIDELVAANIADWVSLSDTTRHLPKLLIRRARILHGLPSGEADFIRVMERELELGER